MKSIVRKTSDDYAFALHGDTNLSEAKPVTLRAFNPAGKWLLLEIQSTYEIIPTTKSAIKPRSSSKYPSWINCSSEWIKKEERADRDIDEGKIKRFSTIDQLLESLNLE